MSEPRFISHAEAQSDFLVKVMPFTLTNDDILHLINGPYVTIIPKTETLGYSGVPTKLFVPTHVIFKQNYVTTYDPADPSAYLWFGWGSDAGLVASKINSTFSKAILNEGSSGTGFAQIMTDSTAITLLNDSMLDNALVMSLYNASAGELTGGDPANILHGWVYYVETDFT